MLTARFVRDKGLPVLVLDLPEKRKETPPVKKRRLRKSGGIPVSYLKIQYQINAREYGHPNRHFPSMFGPGGISGGYADSSWL